MRAWVAFAIFPQSRHTCAPGWTDHLMWALPETRLVVWGSLDFLVKRLMIKHWQRNNEKRNAILLKLCCKHVSTHGQWKAVCV